MKLYGFAPTRVIRVVWTVQELGIDYEFINVDLTKGQNRDPEFLRVNPAGKLPALVDGDFVLTESVAIVLYLAEKYPEKGLLPTDLRGRAQAYRWLLFAATELEQPLWRVARHESVYPEEERIPGDVPLARRDFTDMAAVLDEHMKGREFVAGNSVSVADFVMAYTLDWANEVQLLEPFPGLRGYMARMYARPRAALRITAAFASLEQGE